MTYPIQTLGDGQIETSMTGAGQRQFRDEYESIHAPSYYASSSNRRTIRAQLNGRVNTDICVVGGGYSGLSTALTLGEKGYDVCLLEGKLIGWGASGRNGGQIVNGLNASLDKVRRQFGTEAEKFVGQQVCEGANIIRGWIKKYQIDCDYHPGNVFAAFTNSHMKDLEAKQKLWRQFGMDNHELLDAKGIQAHIKSDAYCGGMIDHSGGHLHPLNLALGEADAIESLNGRVFEGTRVNSITKSNGHHVVSTDKGEVHANRLVLCGNAYLAGVVPHLEKRIMPVSTQIVTTEPLGQARAKSLLPTNLCVEDVRYILDYYRLTADHRLLFGGGLVYGGKDPDDIRKRLHPNLLKIFPELRGVKLAHAWSGNFALSYSRVPQLGRLDDGTYFAHGYSGHGVTGSHLFGRILAETIDGDTARFDTFSSYPYLSFPGGRALRVPYSVAGSWWYVLKDRLGI